MIEAAVKAARIGGEVVMRYRGKKLTRVAEKGMNDFVTEVDQASQDAIVSFLRREYPQHSILAEEQAAHEGTSDYRWIIDPLDGTTNFIHDYPCFAVSVGLWRGDEGLAGAILDPVSGELFQAQRGAGAWLGDERITVSDATGLKGSLLVTGFPFREIERLDDYLISFAEIFRRSAGVRRDGSAALDLCYVACGRLDGFWERGLAPWDLAAGAVILEEAGGTITDYRGKAGYLESGNVIAAPSGVHAELMETLRSHRGSV